MTQALWLHVMGSNPSRTVAPRHPVENVSWHQVSGPDGFLARINQGTVRAALSPDRSLSFRLPSESEWEYAARGGPHWRDDYAFAGSNNPDDVAWYGPRWTRAHDLARRIFGWRFAWRVLGRRRLWMLGPRHTHEVAAKRPNQLGIHDMSGNVWEWCADTCTDDLDLVPADGTPWCGPGHDACAAAATTIGTCTAGCGGATASLRTRTMAASGCAWCSPLWPSRLGTDSAGVAVAGENAITWRSRT